MTAVTSVQDALAWRLYAIPTTHREALCGREASAMRGAAARALARPKPLEGAADTDVLRYNLSIEAVPSSQSLIGSNEMTVQSLVDGLNQFTFRLSSDFTITAMTLNGSPISFTRLDSATVRADFGATFNSGQLFTLRVDYNGVPTGGAGFGSINFRTRSSGAQEVWTLSEPYYAYTWWPGKDENNDKALVDLAVTVPNTMVVASNGLLQGTDTLTGNRLRYRWSSGYPIATYLVSFSATNFNTWTGTYNHAGGSMPVSFFIYPENDTTNNRNGWNNCIQMITTFATVFGEYPFVNEKYGIYNFGFSGGMEHQTMTGQSGFTESLTAHELTHQWWGDMVTCETWHDIWLNEGFATYGEAIWLERKPGSTGLPALKSAMAARKPSSVNGTVYRTDISSVNAIFSSNFAYRKGAWVLHQLRRIVGDATFFAILAEWRSRYLYDAATTEDFIDVASSVAGQDLRWYFDPWVYQPGALAFAWGNQTVTVDGRQYLLLRIRQTQSTSYPTFRMPVDFRYTVSGSPLTKVLWNFARTQHYVIPIPSAASSLSLDPDGWLLTTSVSTETYQPGPPKIVRVFPDPGPASDADLSVIRVTFHTPVNVSPGDFTIKTRSGITIPFSMSYVSGTNTAVLSLASDVDFDGLELTVRDTITAVNSGQQLDGETPDHFTLPSGDGVPGGAAIIRFAY